MLKLTVFEFLLRLIPEAFVLMFALFMLCNIEVVMNRYIVSSILLGIFEYIIRFLPINYGVNTIIGIFIMIIIMYRINNSDMIASVKASLIVTIILFICEWVNVLLLNIVLGDKLEIIMNNFVLKTIAGIPSLICLAIITWIYHLKKRRYSYDKD
ncbi:hypothetical protein [Clostridium butyricum]|uniref:hypothetical protein n=1 Tax=Clostridium butyricum TaxID=1492 RepID=UPI0011DD7852|nr:hypothetical protein [Clostridium butyricum]MCQ2019729.1 hypothetical protein [Clostridium butyricum]MCQ2020673.1 hypothetical protein [Clostridium butyricum]NFB71455.1 hypothetical protein [Clostridium butyricum]NFB91631.1 hypothetical protein [Clostridium butyricum]UTY54117.1 hypothetical protein HNS01_13785 [Clostridium butyricum]